MATLIDNTEASPIREICDRYQNRPDALLEILHAVQAADGFVSDAALTIIADALNISRAEAHGVVSFYHDFKREKPPQTVLKICRAEACQAVGSEDLAQYAETKLGVGFGDSANSAGIGLQAVYCLGNCALGPAMMIDETLYARVTPTQLDVICTEHRAKRRSSL